MVHRDPSFLERYRLLIAVATAILVLFVLSGWMMRRGVVSVLAEKVTREQIASVISTNGKVEPVRNYEAHAAAPATVQRVYVREGDTVKAGQLLLQLDDSAARAQAAKALTQLKSAEADLHSVQSGGTQDEINTTRSDLIKAQAEREAAGRNLEATLRLQQNGAASPGEVEEARNRVQRADAEVQLLQSRLSGRFSGPDLAKAQAFAAEARAAYAAALELVRNSQLRAPFDGVVYQLPVRPGAFVNSGDLLVQMADLNTVQVRAFVDEPEIGKLAKGEKVEITWDALPGRTWEGSVTRLPTAVTSLGTRTVGETTCELENSDHKLLPNVNVNVSVITARHESALTVSREAVHDVDGRHMVYEIAAGRLRTREVQTGTSSLTRVEILTGIAEGTEIATRAVTGQALRNGIEVKVAER